MKKQNLTDEKIMQAMTTAKKYQLPDHFLAKKIEFDHKHGYFILRLKGGYILIFSLNDFPSLKSASPEQRENFSFPGNGAAIHWDDIDEDLSVRGLLIEYARKSSKFVNEAFDFIPA
jgi:Protein of unknown function (DUF2442)